jgi:hypothetical protein
LSTLHEYPVTEYLRRADGMRMYQPAISQNQDRADIGLHEPFSAVAHRLADCGFKFGEKLVHTLHRSMNLKAATASVPERGT